MKKWSFFALLLTQGIIHFFGFLKAYVLFPLVEINTDIASGEGPLWLTAAALFVMSAMMFISRRAAWPFAALAGVAVSQYLVIGHWNDAFLLTIANVMVFLTAVGYLLVPAIVAVFRHCQSLIQHWQEVHLHHHGSNQHFAHH
jgi:hypothetical protein